MFQLIPKSHLGEVTVSRARAQARGENLRRVRRGGKKHKRHLVWIATFVAKDRVEIGVLQKITLIHIDSRRSLLLSLSLSLHCRTGIEVDLM